jgi:hypothetical protein
LAALPLALVLALTSFSELGAQDWSRYQPGTIASLVATYPAQTGITLSPDIPVRLRLRYSSEFRELTEESRRLLDTWGETMRVSGLLQAFRREVKVYEAGTEYWLAVQERLVGGMKTELRRDDEFEVYAIYIGQIEGRHVLLINAFDHATGTGHRR